MKKTIAIFAIDEELGIGKDGGIPWKGDYLNFKNRTLEVLDETKQNALIMGRRTFESFPENMRPLPGRKNIVISRSLEEVPEGAYLARSLDEAYEMAQNDLQIERVFVVGGAGVFQEAWEKDLLDECYFTFVPGLHECDTLLDVNFSELEPYFEEQVQGGKKEDHILYTFQKYLKK